MSRGIPEEEAKKKIVEGYFLPVLEHFEGEMREKIEQMILEELA